MSDLILMKNNKILKYFIKLFLHYIEAVVREWNNFSIKSSKENSNKLWLYYFDR